MAAILFSTTILSIASAIYLGVKIWDFHTKIIGQEGRRCCIARILTRVQQPRYALCTRGASRLPLNGLGAVADSRAGEQLIMSALIFHRRPIQLHSLDAALQLRRAIFLIYKYCRFSKF